MPLPVNHCAAAPPWPAAAAGVKRLFDLVKCPDERLRVAFYYALRDTLVAGDLEQASRIAYGQDKRWRRVVTLKVGGLVAGRRAGGQRRGTLTGRQAGSGIRRADVTPDAMPARLSG